MSLLRILERHQLLDAETLARLRQLQADKGYLLEEALSALGPRCAAAADRARELLGRERRRKLNMAGLLRVFTELRQHPGAAGALLVLSAVSALLSFPFVFSWYLGAVLRHLRYSQDVSSLWTLTAVAVTVLVANTLLELLRGAWASRCNFLLSQGLVVRCWQRLLYMPYPLYQRQEQGALLSRLTHVLEELRRHQLYVLRNLLHALCILLVTAGALLFFHFAFVLIFVPAVLLTYLLPAVISNRAAPYLRQEPRTLGRLSGFLQVAFASHWLLRFQGAEAVKRRLNAIADVHFINQARKWLTLNLGYNSKVTFNMLSLLSVLWGGGALHLAGAIGLDELITVYFLITLVTPRLDELYRIYVYGQSLHANYEVLDELLDTWVPPASEPPGEGRAGEALGALHSLRLEGVSFRYRPDGSEVLRDVSLELRRGQSYVVTGESGAGKSTLVDLLLGLLTPDSGRLLVNHQPLAPGAHPALWRRVSLHDQSHFAFLDRSAEANIAPPEAGAARGAGWERLAERLGLSRWGGQHPGTLSGGERQRLCLLRALARRADVYVFDEPTSALDDVNASAVMEHILSLRDAIVLVISHDPQVIRHFDFVINVGSGRILLQEASGRERERRG